MLCVSWGRFVHHEERWLFGGGAAYHFLTTCQCAWHLPGIPVRVFRFKKRGKLGLFWLNVYLFPLQVYVPTVFENYVADITVGGVQYELALWVRLFRTVRRAVCTPHTPHPLHARVQSCDVLFANRTMLLVGGSFRARSHSSVHGRKATLQRLVRVDVWTCNEWLPR